VTHGPPTEEPTKALGINEEAIRHNLGLTLTKLVANDHSHKVIKAEQNNLPPIISKAEETGKPIADYVTKIA